jgi:hypothetical protein
MSHRKTNRNQLNGKAGLIEAASASAYSWSFTQRILGTHVTALELSQNEDLGPDEFFKMLQTLDMSETQHSKLDREKITNIPNDVRDLFLRQYLSACVTGMAENQGILIPLENSAMVSFPKGAESQPAAVSKQPPLKPQDESYALVDPAIAPFEAQIPCFHGTFLGILQTRLQKLLTVKRLLPANIDNEIELDALMELATDKITEERMFGECRAATAEYFRLLFDDKEPAAITVISKIGAPFVFLWLMCSGLLDDMIACLLRGKPLMRAKDPAGPLQYIAYEPTEFGNKIGLWKLDPEAK